MDCLDICIKYTWLALLSLYGLYRVVNLQYLQEKLCKINEKRFKIYNFMEEMCITTKTGSEAALTHRLLCDLLQLGCGGEDRCQLESFQA